MLIIAGFLLIATALILGMPLHLVTSRVEWSQVLLLAGVGACSFGLVNACKTIVLDLLGAIALVGSVALFGYGVHQQDMLIMAVAAALLGAWAQSVDWSKGSKKKTA